MNKNKRGLTLAEILIASAITFLVLGVSFTLWSLTETAWYGERARAKTLMELEIAMERIKKEVRSSTGDLMFFYPEGASVYEAISFPLAVDDDGDGFIELDNNNTQNDPTDDTIIWDRTIIYHVYNTGTTLDLRRTIFDPRSNLNDNQRQSQIDSIVLNGQAIESTPNSVNASTRTVFSKPVLSGQDAISLEIIPKLREFDGYSAALDRSSNVSFGSMPIDAGYHTISFKTTRKNAASSNYGTGVDLFRITPSGSDREGEDYTFLKHPDNSVGITATSGDSVTRENMSSYGSWSGDYHLDYAANGVGDYITLRFYNDAWRESNFDSGTSDLVVAELSARTGVFDGLVASSDGIVRLEGGGSVWFALDQTGAALQTIDIIPPAGGTTIRNVISGGFIGEDGRLIRVKFTAGASGPLTINHAVISKRKEAQAQSETQDGEAPSSNITFSGNPSVVIASGDSVWSDWIDLGGNMDKSNDYLVSIYLPQPNGTQHSLAYREDASGLGHSYIKTGGDFAGTLAWGGTGTEETRIYILDEIEASYVDSGSFTSQVYDTGIVGPQFAKITWDITRNNYPDANCILKVRSSNDKNTLLADSDWSDETAVNTYSAVQGSAGISAIGTGRYVQFYAELVSVGTDPGEQTADQYDMSSILKAVAIYWPGATTACALSGYFTMKPSYGVFTVEVDGQPLTKGFEIKLELAEKIFDIAVERTLTTEVEPRNTGL